MARFIHILVNHNLGQDKAFDRVLTWLHDHRNDDPRVQALSTTVQNVSHSIALKLNAYSYPVDVTIVASPSTVELKTNAATDLVEAAGMWYEERQLRSQLSQLLK